MLHKNEAVFYKTQASDQWNFYQSKSNKVRLMELTSDMVLKEKNYYKSKIEKYEADKEEIKKKAESLEAKSEEVNKESDALMVPHHKLAQSMTLIQIAI
jgi:phosphopantetheine adenylyltransferase